MPIRKSKSLPKIFSKWRKRPKWIYYEKKVKVKVRHEIIQKLHWMSFWLVFQTTTLDIKENMYLESVLIINNFDLLLYILKNASLLFDTFSLRDILLPMKRIVLSILELVRKYFLSLEIAEKCS